MNSSYKLDIIKLSGGMDDDNKYKYNGFYYRSKSNEDAVASNENVLSISKRLIEKNKESYEVLAK